MDRNTLIIKGIPPFLNYIRAISGLWCQADIWLHDR